MRERTHSKNKKIGERGPLGNGSGRIGGSLDPLEKGAQQKYHWRDPLVG